MLLLLRGRRGGGRGGGSSSRPPRSRRRRRLLLRQKPGDGRSASALRLGPAQAEVTARRGGAVVVSTASAAEMRSDDSAGRGLLAKKMPRCGGRYGEHCSGLTINNENTTCCQRFNLLSKSRFEQRNGLESTS